MTRAKEETSKKTATYDGVCVSDNGPIRLHPEIYFNCHTCAAQAVLVR